MGLAFSWKFHTLSVVGTRSWVAGCQGGAAFVGFAPAPGLQIIIIMIITLVLGVWGNATT